MTAAFDLTGPQLNATAFRTAHESEWARLDALVTRIEKRSVRVLTDDELLALPLLYRATISSLAVARTSSLDRALIAYLEALSTRAYFQMYGAPGSLWRQLAGFFARGLPDAVRSLWRETLASAALIAGGALIAYLLVHRDPEWFFAIIPQSVAGGRDPGATAAFLRDSLHHQDVDRLGLLPAFAASLFTHNSQVSLFAFALGFAFAVPTALLMIYNGMMLGALTSVYAGKGLGVDFLGWIAIHGTTELLATALAGAAGFRIGLVIAFPGRLARLDAAVIAGRQAALVMGGVVVMLIFAGLLEGIGRQTITGEGARYAIGIAMLIGWLAYFYVPRGRDASAGD